MKKRIIALLLSLVMLTSLLTPTALATEGEESGTAQEEVVKSNENERTDLNGATENGDAKDENQDPQQPTTGDEEQPTGQDEPKNEDETKGEDGRPGEEPKQPEQTGDEQPTEPEQGEEPETPEEPEFDAEAVYVQLMACKTVEEMDAIAAELTEEQISQFTDEQLAAIEARYAELKGEEPEEPEEDVVDNGIVNFTDVAPLVEPGADVVIPGILKAVLLGATARPEDPYPEQLPKNANGVETSKKVDGPDDNGNYTITMESFVTGSVKAGEVKPCDIVLVLDMSTSMEETFSNQYTKAYPRDSTGTYYVETKSGWSKVTWCSRCKAWTDGCSSSFLWHSPGKEYIPKTSANDTTARRTQFYSLDTRLEALQAAASNFVTKVAEKEEVNRIAVVGFHDGGVYLTGDRAGNALLNAKAKEATIKDAINGIGKNDLEAATDHNDGLQLARDIFAADNSDQQRQKVVVMITDGEPEPMGKSYWSATTVKGAIEYSYELKNSYSASVYTVSVMPGSNAENPTSPMDRYMSYISSNYPNARYTGTDTRTTNQEKIIQQITPGTRADTGGKSYYLSAGDTSALEDIFGQIADQTGGATIELTTETVVKDVVSKYFTLPEGAREDDITIYTADATGEKDENGKYLFGAQKKSDLKATIGTDEDGNQTVSVTGFDFNHNFVADTGRVEGDVSQAGDFYGRKLIIQFQVKAKDAFWGGNAVPTNDPSSGIYDGTTVVENFEHPTADVKLKVPTVTGSTTNIYYGGTIPDTDTLYTIDDYDSDMMAYVDVDATQINAPSNTEDTNATVTVKVSPKYTGSITGSTRGTAAVKINVFKPVITWQDSQIDLGETAKYEDNFVKVEWKHGTDEAKREMGPAPTLVYEYDKAVAAFTQDTPVKVTVKLGTLDITSAVTFVHEDCTFKDCNFDAAKGQFIVHIKPFDLTITKAGRDPIDENQAFVFHVKSEDANVDMYVTIRFGSDSTTRNSVTIKDLKPGTYKITEESGWSWRYEVTDGASKTIEPKNVGISTPGQASVSFANSRTKTLWLNGCSWAVNNWNSSTPTKAPATPGSAN